MKSVPHATDRHGASTAVQIVGWTPHDLRSLAHRLSVLAESLEASGAVANSLGSGVASVPSFDIDRQTVDDLVAWCAERIEQGLGTREAALIADAGISRSKLWRHLKRLGVRWNQVVLKARTGRLASATNFGSLEALPSGRDRAMNAPHGPDREGARWPRPSQRNGNRPR